MEILSDQALVYDDLIDSSDVFHSWYNVLWKLKREFPSNKIIKKLASSAWGELQNKKIFGRPKNRLLMKS